MCRSKDSMQSNGPTRFIAPPRFFRLRQLGLPHRPSSLTPSSLGFQLVQPLSFSLAMAEFMSKESSAIFHCLTMETHNLYGLDRLFRCIYAHIFAVGY